MHPKEKLNILKNDTIDSTSFKRGSLYKVTDFQNLEQALGTGSVIIEIYMETKIVRKNFTRYEEG